MEGLIESELVRNSKGGNGKRRLNHKGSRAVQITQNSTAERKILELVYDPIVPKCLPIGDAFFAPPE